MMKKEWVFLIVIFVLVIALIELTAWYIDLANQVSRKQLTPELVNVLSKEEIKYYLELSQKEDNSPEKILILIAGVSGFLLGILGYYLGRSKNRVPVEELLLLLQEPEKTIIRILVEKGGEAEQQYLRKRTGMNKVQMTRIISEMKEKELVSVEKLGKTNLVRIHPRIKKLFL